MSRWLGAAVARRGQGRCRWRSPTPASVRSLLWRPARCGRPSGGGGVSAARRRADPGAAWEVNAAAPRGCSEAAPSSASRGSERPDRCSWLSSAEVYGPVRREPRVETDPCGRMSPYAASKVGAEVAARSRPGAGPASG